MMLGFFTVLVLCRTTRTDLCGGSLTSWTLRHCEIQIYRGFQNLIWTIFLSGLNLNTTMCFHVGNLFMFDTVSG